MPIPELPTWITTVGAIAGGGLLTELVRAMRARGQALSTERLTLQQSEADFRATLIAENRDQRRRLDDLEARVMELVENERKCDERNRELESEIVELRERNEELQKDIDALAAKVSRRAKDIVADSLHLPAARAR